MNAGAPNIENEQGQAPPTPDIKESESHTPRGDDAQSPEPETLQERHARLKAIVAEKQMREEIEEMKQEITGKTPVSHLLQKCPRTLIITAGQDILRAESLQFAKILREAGVDVDEREYEKARHPFMAMDKYLDSGGQAVEYVVKLPANA